MPARSYEKLHIARKQLDTAIRLFREGDDLFSVITLAGAAEEILGQHLRHQGLENSLDELIQASVAIYKTLFAEPADPRAFAKRANQARNALKHHSDSEQVTVTLDPGQEAIDMLARAVTNQWRLSYDLSDEMRWFTEWQRSQSIKNAHADDAAE